MFCGSPPFFDKDADVVYNLILKGDVSFTDPVWSYISKEAKNLIKALLCPAEERLNSEDALKHPFFY
jgi:serine/threonine protein kinase